MENGEYPVFVGSSEQDIRLRARITIMGHEKVQAPYHWTVIQAYRELTKSNPQEVITTEIFENSIGRELPKEPKIYPYTIESPIMEYEQTIIGKMLFRLIMKIMNREAKEILKLPEGKEKEERLKNHIFMMRFIPSDSPRGLVQSSGGMVQMNLAYALTDLANKKFVSACKRLFQKNEHIPLPCEQQEKL